MTFNQADNLIAMGTHDRETIKIRIEVVILTEVNMNMLMKIKR